MNNLACKYYPGDGQIAMTAEPIYTKINNLITEVAIELDKIWRASKQDNVAIQKLADVHEVLTLIMNKDN